MTIVKDCQLCEKPFTTRTFKSATWERYCPKCFSEKRQTRAVEKLSKHNDNDMTELRDRVCKVEEHLDNIPAITHAEINNQLGNLSELAQFDSIKEGLSKVIDERVSHLESDLHSQVEVIKIKQAQFEEKIQKQLGTLNNKLVRLMREMD